MKQVVTFLVTTMMLSAAGAQERVQTTIDRLKQAGAITLTQQSRYSNDGRQTGLLEVYDIDGGPGSVGELLAAFDADSTGAYNYVRHKAGDDKQAYAIYYDSNNCRLIGTDNDNNYVLLSVTDPIDSSGTFRYCYAMEWDGDNHGCVIKTYAPRPRTAGGSPLRQPVVTIGDLIDSSLAIRLETITPMADSLRLRLGALWTNSPTTGTGPTAVDEVEWLTAFNHYRNAFKRAAQKNKSSATSYAAELLKLCRTAQDVQLSDRGLSLCRKALKELRRYTDDDFVSGLLDEAADLL